MSLFKTSHYTCQWKCHTKIFISGLNNNDDLLTIAKAAFPFFLLMLLAEVLITVFPEIVLFLPNKMK